MTNQNHAPELAGELAIDPKLVEEIQRVLEMMQRVKTAAQLAPKEIQETAGNTYVLPEPPVFQVSPSTEGD